MKRSELYAKVWAQPMTQLAAVGRFYNSERFAKTVPLSSAMAQKRSQNIFCTSTSNHPSNGFRTPQRNGAIAVSYVRSLQ